MLEECLTDEVLEVRVLHPGEPRLVGEAVGGCRYISPAGKREEVADRPPNAEKKLLSRSNQISRSARQARPAQATHWLS